MPLFGLCAGRGEKSLFERGKRDFLRIMPETKRKNTMKKN